MSFNKSRMSRSILTESQQIFRVRLGSYPYLVSKTEFLDYVHTNVENVFKQLLALSDRAIDDLFALLPVVLARSKDSFP